MSMRLHVGGKWGFSLAFGAFAFFGLAVAAQAQGRPDVRTMTCGEVRALVDQNRAIVLTTGRYTYDRYVSNQRYCPIGFATKPAWVDTSDQRDCRIGYTCVPDEFLRRRWR